MKILQILPELKEGGVETGTLDLVRFLQQRKHTVTVISNGGPLVETLQAGGIRHLTWPVHKKNPLTILWLSLKLRRFVKKHGIDLIHARSRVPGWITYLAVKGTHTSWVTTCHGYYRLHFGSRVMGWADKVIVASYAIKRHMLENFNVPKKNIEFIPRGVDLHRFPFKPKPFRHGPVIGMIGRLTPIKGHRDFLQALHSLKGRNIPFKAEIIGGTKNDRYLEDLQTLTHQLKLTNDIHFRGHQSDIPQCLEQLDLLVLATTYPEAFGRVIIEAQAMGIPVIATAVGGVKEVIIDQVTGWLVPPKNPDALAKKMEWVIQNKAYLVPLLRAARKRVEDRYTNTEMSSSTEAVYSKLTTPNNILIIKQSSLGDMVLISPSLRALKQAYPNTTITLLTNPECRELIGHSPHVDEVLYLSKREQKRHPLDFIKTIRKKKIDLSIDFQNSHWSHLFPYLANIPKRLGYERKGGRLFLSHPTQHQDLPPVEHQFQVLKPLGIDPSSKRLEFWFSKEDATAMDSLLKVQGLKIGKPLLGIHIGASWPTKQWRASHIATLCNKMVEAYGVSICLTGQAGDLDIERHIMAGLTYPVHSLVGKTTLRQLGAFIKRCSLFITPDSLPLHIAAAVGTPTASIFGPTDPNRHRPPADNLLILQEKVDCGPCYRSVCKHHSCMVRLEPDRVFQQIKHFF